MYIGISSLHLSARQKPGGPPFTPASVAALTCWADPSNLSTMTQSSVSGGAVTTSGQLVGTVASSAPATVGWTVPDADRWNINQSGSQWFLNGNSIGWTTTGSGGGSTTAFCMLFGGGVTSGFVDYIYSEHTTASPNIGYDLFFDGNTNTYAFSSGNGTTRTTVHSTAVTAIPVANHVVMAWDDGVNLNIQVDNGTVNTVARATVSAGSLNPFVASPDGTGTNAFFGNLYGLMWAKNNALTSTQRANLKTWLGAKMGLSL